MEDNTDTLTQNKNRKSNATKTKPAVAASRTAGSASQAKLAADADSSAANAQSRMASAQKTSRNKVNLQQSQFSSQITPEQRYHMIETAAYFLAEQHGFNGNPEEEWLVAENQIDHQLANARV